jgi:hypothetical protein
MRRSVSLLLSNQEPSSQATNHCARWDNCKAKYYERERCQYSNASSMIQTHRKQNSSHLVCHKPLSVALKLHYKLTTMTPLGELFLQSLKRARMPKLWNLILHPDPKSVLGLTVDFLYFWQSGLCWTTEYSITRGLAVFTSFGWSCWVVCTMRICWVTKPLAMRGWSWSLIRIQFAYLLLQRRFQYRTSS